MELLEKRRNELIDELRDMMARIDGIKSACEVQIAESMLYAKENKIEYQPDLTAIDVLDKWKNAFIDAINKLKTMEIKPDITFSSEEETTIAGITTYLDEMDERLRKTIIISIDSNSLNNNIVAKEREEKDSVLRGIRDKLIQFKERNQRDKQLLILNKKENFLSRLFRRTTVKEETINDALESDEINEIIEMVQEAIRDGLKVNTQHTQDDKPTQKTLLHTGQVLDTTIPGTPKLPGDD